ncbi:SurA N-terminal domain-containing protein [Pseudonocardia sp. ICBG1293]|uniref:SurA N-terminal domain-containing protein n=1 Tax=Pseudonocardia sp. ICBG1293 TaxID=2844382 RepID=UPI001CCA2F22|nr:SurA N-terminal domain-containing protein [Pseudonocardia sp. ICBG1293]
MSSDPGQHDAPQYYRPGPSTGRYPQYPQNPYPNGWHGGSTPPASPQQAPAAPTPAPQPGPGRQAGQGPQWNAGSGWGPPPAGLGSGPQGRPARPRQVLSALIVLVAAALPFVVMGIGAMFATITDAVLDDTGIPRADIDAALAQTGLTMDQLTQFVRVMGGVFLVLGLVWIALAVVAFLGAGGARIALAVLAGVYGIPLLLLMAPTLPLFAVLVVVLSVAGVALLYGPAAKEWYATRRLGAASRS